MDREHLRALNRPGCVRSRGRRLLGLEALEGRRLLNATWPDLAVLSVSTADSRSVVVSYEVRGGDLPEPPSFAIERSADGHPDGSAVPVGPATGVPGLGTAPGLDLDGRPVIAQGVHRVEVAVEGGLPPNPSHPYVVVVADPAHRLAESDESNNAAAFRTHVIGVVTHGGLQMTPGNRIPGWENRMAGALRAEGYDAVIAYNWVAQSHDPGAAARQGPRLAAQIRTAAASFPEGEPVDLHVIGHSEGAVINSLALQELQAGAPPQLQAGYVEDTMLDPHAANNHAPGGAQYSVSNGLLGSIARRMIDHYQARAKDPLVVVPPNVDDAEVYYQHTPIAQLPGTNRGIYNLWGQIPVLGPARYYNLTGPRIAHAAPYGVQDWYLLNVVPRLADGPAAAAPGVLTATAEAATPGRGTPQADPARPGFRGTAPVGSVVQILARRPGGGPPAPIGRTVAGADGSWHLTARPLADGPYRIFAQALPSGPGAHPRMTTPLGNLTIASPPPRP